MISWIRTSSAVVLILAARSLLVAGGPVTVDVVSDDGERTVLEVSVEKYDLRPVMIEGRRFVRVVLPGEAIELQAGAPALPHMARSVLVPDAAAVDVSVIASTYHEIAARVAPSKGNLSWEDDPDSIPYRFGPIYRNDAFHPGALATLGEPYIQRDHRGVVLTINPFQYKPVTGVLRVYDSMTVEVRAHGRGFVNVLVRDGTGAGPVRAFEEIHRARFVNYEEQEGFADYPEPEEEGEMLIIAHDAWIPNLDPLVTHKQGNGYTVTVVGVSTIGNTWEQIKQYIQDYYDSHNLAFVLLVGDAQQVATPPRQIGIDTGAADPLYSKLAGSDDYPDILVGRFSARTAADVDTQVARTVEYETLPATTQGWFTQATGIASTDAGPGAGDDDQTGVEHIAEIREWLLADIWDSVDEIYEPVGTTQDVSDAVNAGRGLVNYCGHGEPNRWLSVPFTVDDVDALVNRDELPFIFSTSCLIGRFHDRDKCFAEAWLRATAGGDPTGAAAIYGSSVSQYMAPPMEAQDEFNTLLTDPSRPLLTFGGLCFAASGSMMDAYGCEGADMFDTWIVFGDPSLKVVDTGPESGIKVSPRSGLSSAGPAGGALSTTGKSYTIENLEDVPLTFEITNDQSWVSISQTGGELPVGGSAEVTVSINDHALNLDVGDYSDTVHFTNATTGEGDTTRNVELTVGGAVALKRWTLDTDPGWQREGEWEFGQPTGSGGGPFANPDPTSGATGVNVFGANLEGNISGIPGGPYYVTTGAVDLSGVQDTKLEFQRWLNTDFFWLVDSTIEASNDGSAWTTAWQAPDSIADSSWLLRYYDVSSIADGQSQVYFRWGYEDYGATETSGWNIDDIVVEGRLTTARISLTVGKTELSWSSVGGATGYDVIRGDLDTLIATGGDFTTSTESCLADDVAGTSLPHAAEPPPDEGYWYLLRGVSLSGPMTYQALEMSQVGARDDEINASAASCP